MALTFRYSPKEMGPAVETVTIDRHLYLTEDKTRVVEECDPAGRFLWASPGTEMPREEAERLRVVQPATADEPAEAEVATEDTKAIPAPGDKQRAKPGDKGLTVEELRRRAADLNIQVDNRWGVARLQRAIDEAGG